MTHTTSAAPVAATTEHNNLAAPHTATSLRSHTLPATRSHRRNPPRPAEDPHTNRVIDLTGATPTLRLIPPQQVRKAPTPAAVTTPTSENGFLPQPPTDTERDSYLGPQKRWIGGFSFLSYLLIVTSLYLFVARNQWAWFLLIPVVVTAVGSIISLLTSTRRRRDSLTSHRRRVRNWQPAGIPSVDVFLPSAGEDLAVLANTFHHVAKLQWVGELNVYVLDDSGRHQVRLLADRHDFHYLSRSNRGEFKKAGNLRYGFDHSDGDFILILDADFVPRPDALYELAPYFDDVSIGIVQSPQYFDILPEMNWLQRAAGATQILFYRWVQPSRDRSNAPICVGTSALYRRKALDRAGGYALIGHSEDVHTGVKLMKVGYRVRYVPTVVTKGLCPDHLDQFMTQQYRWCTGSMSLLFSTAFHRMKLSTMQRLSYWSGFLYYITTGINVFTLALPPILLGVFAPERITATNYVFVALALVGRQAIVPIITMGKESLFGLARVQTMYSFCHALALWDVVRGRTDSWVATGAKARSRTAERVHRVTRRWCLGVQIALWAVIAWNIPVYGFWDFSLMVVFALTNLYVTYPLIKGRADLPTLVDVPRLAPQWMRQARESAAHAWRSHLDEPQREPSREVAA